jgi:hypothetical protein
MMKGSNTNIIAYRDAAWDLQLDILTYLYIAHSQSENVGDTTHFQIPSDLSEQVDVYKFKLKNPERGWEKVKEQAYQNYLDIYKTNTLSKEEIFEITLKKIKHRVPLLLNLMIKKPIPFSKPDFSSTTEAKHYNISSPDFVTHDYTYFSEVDNQQTNLKEPVPSSKPNVPHTKEVNYHIPRKEADIWQTYLRMRRTRDLNLSNFFRDPKVQQVINKKDFEVYMGKQSELYHRRNCGYLSRSRVLRHMRRSDAILRGYKQCTACIKEFNLGIGFVIIMICSFIFLIIMMVWVVLRRVYVHPWMRI